MTKRRLKCVRKPKMRLALYILYKRRDYRPVEELQYPFDSQCILQKKKSIKRKLLADGTVKINKKIAILGGSTTNDIRQILELFLLDNGIAPTFYESEYAQYWEDAMFGSPELIEFQPDIIFIHTSNRNIKEYPTVRMSKEEIGDLLETTYQHFEEMWDRIREMYHCVIIQNNFEPLFYRLMGNKDVSDVHGRLNFINRLNQKFYTYAETHDNFFINDINFLASAYGLEKWSNPFYWHMYKYCLEVPAIPEFAYNLANIIKSIYGKNKKAYVLDLDNTLWGGIVGDDGPEHIEIGQETSVGQMYSEFQSYLKAHKDLGVLLTVDSKNDEENALAGLQRPDSILKPEDFTTIKANWEPKDRNFCEIAEELNIGKDSMIFVDDNPAEREIVRAQVPGTTVPEVSEPEHYIQVLDRCGYFEVTNLSDDDLNRNDMYKANIERKKQAEKFSDYKDYLKSLEMKAEIKPFVPLYMSRIAQLTNKSNQFNLTTKRCSLSDIENFTADRNYITLYGKLEDKFGDNGVVSVVLGHIQKDDPKSFDIDLWLMSCRVLKRDMEFAMMDELVKQCRQRNISTIYGYYYPTAKNKMVKDFYHLQGFTKISEDETCNTAWKFLIPTEYKNKNEVINVEDAL